MISLLEFDVIKPDFGLFFWTTIIFLLFWFVIGKFAFKPIAQSLKKRQDDIQDALDAADNAKAQMSNLQAENERLLAEAREEKMKIIKEAKDAQNKMIETARVKAKEEATKIIESAHVEIENEKNKALAEIKKDVGGIALEIAEKVIRKELSNDAEQKSYVNTLVDDIQLN